MPKYIPLLIGDKYCFCDSDMKILLSPVYKKVIPIGKNYLVQEGKKYLLIDPVTGQTTPKFDQFLPVNTYTKNANAWKNITLYFTNPEILLNQYWFRQSGHYYAAVAADSLIIYDANLAVIAISAVMSKGNYKDVLLLDSLNTIFCVRQEKKEKVNYIRVFNSRITLKETHVNDKDKLTVYPIGKHYLAECRDERCALLKINGNAIDTLTEYKYYLIEQDTMNETFRCLPNDNKSMDSTGKVIFTTVDYLDSNGKKFYNIKHVYNTETTYHDKMQERLYSGPALFLLTPYIDNKIIANSTAVGMLSALTFIDSLNVSYVYYRTGKNYVIGRYVYDSAILRHIGLFGLINNSGETLVPLKYKTDAYPTDSLIIFRDVKDILITDLEGKTLTTIRPGPDTIVQVSYTHSPLRLFQLSYSVMEYGNYTPLKTEWWKYKNGEFRKLTDSELLSMQFDNHLRKNEEIAEIRRLADLYNLGQYALEYYKPKPNKRNKLPLISYYKLKDSVDRTLLKDVTSPFKVYLDYPDLYYATISSGKKLRYVFISKTGTLYYKKE